MFDGLCCTDYRALVSLAFVWIWHRSSKGQSLKSAQALQHAKADLQREADSLNAHRLEPKEERATRSQLRGYVYDVVAEMKYVSEQKAVPGPQRNEASTLLKSMSGPVEYAPWWVRTMANAKAR